MHDRISVNQLCFPGASVAELARHWQALGTRRVSFVSPPLLGDDFENVQTAVATGDVRVETIAHVFVPGGHLSPHEADWQAARDSLTQLIARARRLGARSIYLVT